MALRREGRAPHLTRPTGLAGEVGLLRTEVADELSQLEARLASERITTRTVSSSSILTTADRVLLVDTSTGAVTLVLPTPVDGSLFVVKKTTLDTHEIIIDPPASESVEGGASGSSFTLPSSDIALRGSWTLLCDGVDWWLV